MKFIKVELLIHILKVYSQHIDGKLISEEKLKELLEQFGHDRFINRENNEWEE